MSWLIHSKTVLSTKWSSVNHRSGAGQGKSASQRPTPKLLSHAAKYRHQF